MKTSLKKQKTKKILLQIKKSVCDEVDKCFLYKRLTPIFTIFDQALLNVDFNHRFLVMNEVTHAINKAMLDFNLNYQSKI